MANFSEVILKSVVCLDMSEPSGYEAVTTLIEAAVKQGVLDKACMDDAIKAVLKREQSASTAMPDGIALPHGRIDCIQELVCMIGIHPGGVEFGSPDGLPTHIFVQLLVPATVGCNHIHFLANLSRRLMEQSVRSDLLSSVSRGQVVEAILCHSDEGAY
jgi:mannitol/fructose-specific phosphotransferase system IIA component (Ntr-type)